MKENQVGVKTLSKKLICIALIIMMLASSFITPIKILADELNSSNEVVTESNENV